MNKSEQKVYLYIYIYIIISAEHILLSIATIVAPLHESGPNTEIFLVRIFPHSV